METLFGKLVGVLDRNPPQIATVVAENFSFLEDQARFLKATLAIPQLKTLRISSSYTRLVQIGPIQKEVEDQVRRAKWTINQYENFGESICDRIEEDLNCLRGQGLIFFNDVSRLELASEDPRETMKLLKLVHKLKVEHGQFCILLYQGSIPGSSSKLLRDMEYMSGAVVHVRSCKAGYFKSIWLQKSSERSVFIPLSQVETSYWTCKIGKSYWSPGLLCFFDCNQVPKNYDLLTDTYLDDSGEEKAKHDSPDPATEKRHDSPRKSSECDLPFIKAQNPESSRIFYYPDKEDDIDEDDPDSDLAI